MTSQWQIEHVKKLYEIYRSRLNPVISRYFFGRINFFCKKYQLLRNVSLLSENTGHQLLILLPRENESLDSPLRGVLAGINPKVRGQIRVTYVEDCLSNLRQNSLLPLELRIYACRFGTEGLSVLANCDGSASSLEPVIERWTLEFR
jgi:hypothetical protein